MFLCHINLRKRFFFLFPFAKIDRISIYFCSYCCEHFSFWHYPQKIHKHQRVWPILCKIHVKVKLTTDHEVWNSFKLSIESDPELLSGFQVLWDWSRKCAPASQSIARQSWTNFNLIIRVFVASMQAGCPFLLWVLTDDIKLCSAWRL